MKHLSRIILPALLAAALLGAGCGQVKPETQAVNGDQQSAVTTSTPIPTTVPEPVPTPATSTKPSSDKSKPMESLAFPGIMDAKEVNKKVRIKTTLGDIVIQVDAAAGPNAASNFVYLVKKGFYNGTIFHRVIPGFMIQGGDPTGTGSGGPGYEFDNDQVKGSYDKGIVAMANAGRNTNGSQFFIMVADYPLGPDYSIFGKVVSGQDVADAIAATPRNSNDRPNTEVKMVSVTIE